MALAAVNCESNTIKSSRSVQLKSIHVITITRFFYLFIYFPKAFKCNIIVHDIMHRPNGDRVVFGVAKKPLFLNSMSPFLRLFSPNLSAVGQPSLLQGKEEVGISKVIFFLQAFLNAWCRVRSCSRPFPDLIH